MTAPAPIASIDKDALHAIAQQACERIAPTWPLDQMIAVNPLWERRDQPWATVAEQLWRRAGSRLTLTAADYRLAWQDGQITERHLSQALAETAQPWTPAQLLEFLDQPADSDQRLPLLEDMAESAISQLGWPALITQQIGQCCAAGRQSACA